MSGRKDWENKLRIVTEKIENSSTPNYRDFFERGLIYFELREYEKAIEEYKVAIELSPDFPDAYYKKSVCHNRLKQLDLAIEGYTKAIERNPEYVNAFYNRGSTFDDLGEYQRAIEDYTRCIELDPNSGEHYLNRGFTYRNMNRLDEAIVDQTKCIELCPEDADGYFNRGSSYNDIFQHEKAIEDLTKTIEIDPRFWDAYFNRAFGYYSINDYKNTIKDYSSYISGKGDLEEIDPFYWRGNCFRKLEMFEEAIKDYEHVEKRNKDYLRNEKYLKFCREGLKRKKKEEEERLIKSDILERVYFLRKNLGVLFEKFENFSHYKLKIKINDDKIEILKSVYTKF